MTGVHFSRAKIAELIKTLLGDRQTHVGPMNHVLDDTEH